MLKRLMLIALAFALLVAFVLSPTLALADPIDWAPAGESPPLAVVPETAPLAAPASHPWNVSRRCPPSVLAKGDLERLRYTSKEPASRAVG